MERGKQPNTVFSVSLRHRNFHNCWKSSSSAQFFTICIESIEDSLFELSWIWKLDNIDEALIAHALMAYQIDFKSVAHVGRSEKYGSLFSTGKLVQQCCTFFDKPLKLDDAPRFPIRSLKKYTCAQFVDFEKHWTWEIEKIATRML